MDESARKARYLKETEDLYKAIGRFSVQFEHVCHGMQTAVILALQRDGLRTQHLANAILCDLTAAPMLNVFKSVVAQLRKDEQERKISNNICNQVKQLIEHRNDVIHRTWFIGWGPPEDDDISIATGIKFKNTNKGAEFKSLQYSVTEFDELSEKAGKLADLVLRLSDCLLLHLRFADKFELDENKNYRWKSDHDTL